MPTAEERRDALKAVYQEASACVRCPQLVASRTQVVFGSGHGDADLLFVGESPGRNEDEQGLPFVGAAGKLLSQLLAEIGLERSEVFITTALKCRPPANRDALPSELANCRPYLDRQLELIRPKVVCTLGNFATKLLREDPTGVTRLHGQAEVRTIGSRTVRLLPLYHPAAALYTRTLLDTLRADFGRIPALLALDAPSQPAAPAPGPEPEPAPAPPPDPSAATEDDDEGQLGLF